MPKAVLVIDVPEHCNDCPLRVLWAKYHCVVNGRFCGDEQGFYSSLTKPSWCPLKSLPKKKYSIPFPSAAPQLCEGMTESENDEGWNACIDEIVGEENE